MTKTSLLFIAAIGVAFNLDCRKKPAASKSQGSATTSTSSKLKLIQSVNSARSVLVENGQAAVIKGREAYFFVVPRKFDLDSGEFKIFFSESGNFRQDAELLVDGMGDIGSLSLKLRGRTIEFMAGSRTSVFVCLSPFENASIAKYEGTDPNFIDINRLDFQENPAFDGSALRQFLTEELEKIEK